MVNQAILSKHGVTASVEGLPSGNAMSVKVTGPAVSRGVDPLAQTIEFARNHAPAILKVFWEIFQDNDIQLIDNCGLVVRDVMLKFSAMKAAEKAPRAIRAKKRAKAIEEMAELDAKKAQMEAEMEAKALGRNTKASRSAQSGWERQRVIRYSVRCSLLNQHNPKAYLSIAFWQSRCWIVDSKDSCCVGTRVPRKYLILTGMQSDSLSP